MIKTAIKLILSSAMLACSDVHDEQVNIGLEDEEAVQNQDQHTRIDEDEGIIDVECSGTETEKHSVWSSPENDTEETQAVSKVYRIDKKSNIVQTWNGAVFRNLCKQDCIYRINEKDIQVVMRHDSPEIKASIDFNMDRVAGNAGFSFFAVSKENGVAVASHQVDHDYDKCVRLESGLADRPRAKF